MPSAAKRLQRALASNRRESDRKVTHSDNRKFVVILAVTRDLLSFRGWSVMWLACSVFSAAHAQQSFLERYQARVQQTISGEPRWVTPLFTTSPRIEQGFRADFIRRSLPKGQRSWNLGNANGLQFVPLRRVELRISPPPFFLYTDPRTSQGFGDVAFRAKYLVYGSNEEHHNAIATVSLAASIPTGKNTNGGCCAVLTPVVLLGKGFRRSAFESTLGGTLPVSNTSGLGRQILWNSVLQYRLTRYVWVETEFNSTFFKGGKNDGRSQTFTTPGIILSRVPLRHEASSASRPLVLTLGLGEQIALSHFKTYDHSPILTTRLRF